MALSQSSSAVLVPDARKHPVASAEGDEKLPSTNITSVELDPRNVYSTFAPSKRIVIISFASIIGLLSPLSSNLYTPAIPAIANDLGVSTGAINLTVTSYLVFQGLSPSLWSSIGDSVGRRLLYLIMLTIYLASCIGLALSTTYSTVLVLRGLQAVGSASTTAIGASLIGDLVHVSRRGKFMGHYSALGGAGTAFGPVLGGIFAQYTGWRGIFYFLLSLAAFLLLSTVFLIPETKRSIVEDGSVAPPKYLRPPFRWLDAPKSRSTSAQILGKSFKIDFAAPVRLLVEPECLCSVLFTGVCYTVWQMSMVATSTLYSERYGLSELHIGLTYISNGMGSLSGSILTARLLDREYKLQLKQEQEAQRAENIENAETIREVQKIERARIRPVVIPTIAYLAAVVAFGWVVEYHVHISVSIILAFFVGGLDTVILAAFSTLMVDVFQTQSFSATACLNLFRCLIAAGGTAAIGPLIRAIGVGWTFTFCAGVALASSPFALAEMHYGPGWREKRISRSNN